MKIKQFEGRNGAVRNQLLLIEKGQGANGDFITRETFQSYDSIIAVKTVWDNGDDGYDIDVVLDEKYWDYSTTTGEYRNIFLGEDKSETVKKIKAGIYKLDNLNKGE